MKTAGFVLAGGASSRMGQNKAFLEIDGRRMIEIVADAVLAAAGSVAIIAPQNEYSELGFPVYPDIRTGCGPLAGIETALTHTEADWNLVLACDMPKVDSDILRRILDEAFAQSESSCVMPESIDGHAQPLCAAYHKRALAAITEALENGTRKITGSLRGLDVHYLRLWDPIENINTPEDLARIRGQR
jgi:molybdopterin-guanine dinucleotide biosynthesis protein A